jgi:AraC-like DNA-binding protein
VNKNLILHRDTIGIHRVIQVLQGAARAGVEVPRLLVSCGIPRPLLEDPDARIDRDVFIKLLTLVMEQTQDEFAGFGQGRKSKPGTFSMMAHAVINCSSLGRALQRGIRFYEMFDLNLDAELKIEDGHAILECHADPRLDFREVILESLFLLTHRFMGWLVGKPITLVGVEFDFPDTDDERKVLFSCPIAFSAPTSRMIFSVDYLDLPLVQNELSLSRFLKDSLSQLLQDGNQQMGLPAQIRALLSKEYGYNFPDFSEVCDALNMTPQTLRRRLKDAGTSYQEIKDNIREEASVYYLSKPELSIDEIALLMGFSEASSFHRAFKKWTGQTPSIFRQEHFGDFGDTA